MKCCIVSSYPVSEFGKQTFFIGADIDETQDNKDEKIYLYAKPYINLNECYTWIITNNQIIDPKTNLVWDLESGISNDNKAILWIRNGLPSQDFYLTDEQAFRVYIPNSEDLASFCLGIEKTSSILMPTLDHKTTKYLSLQPFTGSSSQKWKLVTPAK